MGRAVIYAGAEMPIRHQRPPTSQRKGWRKPEGAVLVTRPYRWGNPHPIGVPCPVARCGGTVHTRDECIAAFEADLIAGRHRRHVKGVPTGPALGVDDARRHLAGRDVVCACPLDEPCHGDVILRYANR